MENSHKITIQELIDLLCEKTDVNKLQAENFIKSMFAVIEEKLLAGEQVKINNFGIFKLQWNEPRKSVNINTGEEFIIDGFYKLTFTPEQKLKDTVNEPFTHLKTIVLDEETTEDPLSIFQDQATEIGNILSEISAMNEINNKLEEAKVKEIEIEEPKEFEITVNEEEFEIAVNETEPEIVVNEEVVEFVENPEKVKKDEMIDQNVNVEETNLESEENSKIVAKRKSKKESKNNRKTNKHYGIKYTLFFVSLIIIGVTISYFSSSCFECWVRYDLLNEKGRQNLSNIENTVNSWLSNIKGSDEQPTTNTIHQEKTDNVSSKTEIVEESQNMDLITDDTNIEDDKTPEKDDVQPKTDTNLQKDDVQAKADATPQKDDAKPKTDVSPKKDDTQPKVDAAKNNETLESLLKGPRAYNEFIATETIGRGVNLTLLAHKYYGDRDFWVYIHEANNNKYEKPGNIPAGVEINIPKLDKRLIDVSNPLCKEKARELQSKYMKN